MAGVRLLLCFCLLVAVCSGSGDVLAEQSRLTSTGDPRVFPGLCFGCVFRGGSFQICVQPSRCGVNPPADT